MVFILSVNVSDVLYRDTPDRKVKLDSMEHRETLESKDLPDPPDPPGPRDPREHMVVKATEEPREQLDLL